MGRQALRLVAVVSVIFAACKDDERGAWQVDEDGGTSDNRASTGADASILIATKDASQPVCPEGAKRCRGSTPQTCDGDGWLDGISCEFNCTNGTCTGSCDEGDKRCEGKTPQSCTAEGRWKDGTDCSFVCTGGVCTGSCVPGTKRCDGLTPQTCSATGAWDNGTTCTNVCNAGTCSGSCAPGAKQCDGKTPQTCSSAGAWQDGTDCEFVCNAGECSGACTPGAKQCDGLTPQTCSAEGAWADGTDCSYACNAGLCTGLCTPGSQQCDGLTPQTCNALGAWEDGTDCDYVCSAGDCSGSCVPGTKQCNGITPQTCNSLGNWDDGTNCDYVCSAGECTGSCLPGTKQCDGLTPQTCDSAGSWEDGTDCDYVCSAGDCTGSCVPGTKQCDGLTPQTCNSAGNWDEATDCDYICNAGECTGTCVPDSKRCADATNLETCDSTGTWVSSACAQACSIDACTCSPRYTGDGTTCAPIDYCNPQYGGCSPNADCSQTDVTPSCACKGGFSGDGLYCTTPPTEVLAEGFDNVPALSNWPRQNDSSPVGSQAPWFQGDSSAFSSFSGAATSYIAANYNSTGSVGTISAWLATPPIDFGAESSASFYTRHPGGYADRLEVRLCTTMPCTLPTSSATDTTGYGTLLLSINPNLAATGVYPTTWTQFTVKGLPYSGQGRIAFRYYVTAGGISGSNSDYIGVDSFSASTGTPAYQVGGTVAGLAVGPLSLWLNGLVELAVSADGSFTFPKHLDSGTPYSVAVLVQPTGQTCTVSNAAGSIGSAHVTDVQVNCVANN